MTTIGFIGSGNIGTAVAKQAIAHGYDVVMSNSRGPETLADLIAELGPQARAATATDAAEAGDLVVVTVPFKNYTQVPVGQLADKIVIDTNNYYFERDGRYPSIDDGTTSVSELLAEHLPTSKVVKAFNMIQSAAIIDDAKPDNAESRRALPIAGDDADAKKVIAELLGEFGFDVVDAGPLAEGARFDRDTPAYGPYLTRDQLTEALASAPQG